MVDRLQGIVDLDLCRVAQRRIDVAVEEITYPEHIANEDLIELASLRRLCQMHTQ
jgi:hypothetical protein